MNGATASDCSHGFLIVIARVQTITSASRRSFRLVVVATQIKYSMNYLTLLARRCPLPIIKS